MDKADVTVAKNYLSQPEITELNRVVTMYLDFAEDQARRRKPMHMAEWVQRLDAFLQFNDRDILTHAGAISHQLVEEHAHAQFERYDAERRKLEAALPSSDFDRAVEEVKRLGPSEARPPAKSRHGNPGRPVARVMRADWPIKTTSEASATSTAAGPRARPCGTGGATSGLPTVSGTVEEAPRTFGIYTQ